MKGLNRINLIGNLTDDPVFRYSGAGKPTATATLAVNSWMRNPDGTYNKEAVEYFDLLFFDAEAVRVHEWCNKGGALHLTGALQTRPYTGGDGLTRIAIEVAVLEFMMLSGNTKRGDTPEVTGLPIVDGTQQQVAERRELYTTPNVMGARWAELCSEIKRRSPKLAAMFAEFRPHEIDGQEVTVMVPNAFFENEMRDQRMILLTQESFNTVFPVVGGWHIRYVLSKRGSNEQPVAPATNRTSRNTNSARRVAGKRGR